MRHPTSFFSIVTFLLAAMWLFNSIGNQWPTQVFSIDVKTEALTVLQQKCNNCHRQKNPRKVFTLGNMSGLAPKIYKQVFVKKRMPKPGAPRLTDEEFETLRKWLFTENIKID